MSLKRLVVVATLVTVLGVGLPAIGSAHSADFGGRPGWGPGYMMGWGGGPGWGGHMMGWGGGPGYMMGWGNPGAYRSFANGPIISMALNFRDELKLNAEQVKKLEKLRDDFYTKASKMQTEILNDREQLSNALDSDKVNVAKAEKLIRDLSAKQADLRIARLKTIEQGKAVLTQEQLKKLRDFAYTGFGPRFGRGFGPRYRGFGPGYYGMGPGMMWGWGPGWGPGGDRPSESR